MGCKSDLPPSAPAGPAWVVFTASSSPLVDNSINAITGDAGGKIWFATNNGISRFTPSKTAPTIGEWATFTVNDIPKLKTNKIPVVVTDNPDNSIVLKTGHTQHAVDRFIKAYEQVLQLVKKKHDAVSICQITGRTMNTNIRVSDKMKYGMSILITR